MEMEINLKTKENHIKKKIAIDKVQFKGNNLIRWLEMVGVVAITRIVVVLFEECVCNTSLIMMYLEMAKEAEEMANKILRANQENALKSVARALALTAKIAQGNFIK